MANIPYITIGLIRKLLPHQLLYTMMRQRGDSSMMERNPTEGVSHLCKLMSQAGMSHLGRHIVDLGSGRFARAGVAWIAAGAHQVTLIDLDATPIEDPDHRSILEHDCEALGLEIRDVARRLHVIKGDFLSLQVPSGNSCADIVISNSVLEHVRNPAAILARCHAWLRPGGATLHIVDLRDHNLGFRYPFEMLTYTESTWSRWFDLSGGFHLNRWRVSHYQDAIDRAGFSTVGTYVLAEDRHGAETIQPRLTEPFCSLTTEDLAIQVILLTGERSM